jgi:uncharacterized small protein (DUF1192 family)
MSDWENFGSIKFKDGKLSAPENLPDVPGLYRLEFEKGTFYIGETSNLKRRIDDYLLYYASVGIESEFRINKALLKSQGAEISLLRGPDFESKSQRCEREHQEIKHLKQDLNNTVLNGGTLEDRIEFLKLEIKRLETKLAKQKEKQQAGGTI